ncbi:D-sedoheptulose-7-phosphate isomerase [Streptomyces sp. NPDC003758]|uniref:SIS domain-containing protein n=1 Tax=Streptomyces cynarae TaxID=2981134 RepID=A0ABY6DT63_9ACTN|nr:SIS domain-containing protein [Streptomyces cynarae]UXY17554.1 SIS domain-containing protein [Streptomyces cynarae]
MAKDPGQQLTDHVDLARRVEQLLPQLLEVSRRLVAIYEAGGRLYTFGNGGSAADAQHLAAELVGRYLRERRPLPALALSVDPSVTTCISNDYDFDDLFSRQIEAFAGPGDMVLAFTTSGRSQNVVRGLKTARDRGALTVLFGGGDGGPAAEHADLALLVPSTTTARTQEMHLLLLHLLSEQIDAWAAEGTPA